MSAVSDMPFAFVRQFVRLMAAISCSRRSTAASSSSSSPAGSSDGSSPSWTRMALPSLLRSSSVFRFRSARSCKASASFIAIPSCSAHDCIYDVGSKGDIRSASHCVLPPPAALDMAQDEIKDFCAPITLLPLLLRSSRGRARKVHTSMPFTHFAFAYIPHSRGDKSPLRAPCGAGH